MANNLITTATGFALDARQGKTLSDLINTKQDTLFAPLFCVNRNVSDWDDITQIGWYSGNYAANAPTTGWLNVMVLASNANPNYLVAVAFSFGVSSGSIYGRVRNEGTWRDWYKPT